MARPWIKLHAHMLHHPGIGRLSDRAYRAWITMLLMASQAEEPGVIGSVDDVAWTLHVSRDDVDHALSELNGRVSRDGDMLAVRDWDEWQAPSTDAERQARHRAAAKGDRDDGNGVSRDGHVTSRPHIEEETEVEEEPTTRAAARWAPVEEAIAQSYGGAETRTRTGGVKADVGRLLKLLGEHSGSEPVEAVRLWRLWWASVDGRYRPTMRNAGEKLGAWLAERKAEPRTWTLVKEVDDGA